MKYTADFETIVNKEFTRVWAWAVCPLNDVENIDIGNSIETFIEYFRNKKENSTIYFHNLEFDGEFILYYLLKNGFEHVEDRKQLDEGKFCTLISDKGFFYSIEVCLYKKSHKTYKLKFLDSLKVLPMSVEEIAKTFKLPISKLKIDYAEYREEGHELTEEEREYIKNDVKIVALAINELFKLDLTKMTTASNAMNEYKTIKGEKEFKKLFPTPLYDKDLRRAYKGGFTYLNDKFKGKEVGEGLVLDVNSLYPSVMYSKPMPYGEGVYFQGQYKEDKVFNLYIQNLRCRFELKEGYIPTIQIKNNLIFEPTEYLKSSGSEYVELSLSSVDLELFLEHYDVWEIEYIDGWKFRSTDLLFKEYIDKWIGVKIEATKTGNKGLRAIAKLMLNSLYGKFAMNPRVQSKIPYLEDDVVHYALGEVSERSPIYIPIGIFVTAWGRYVTITSAQKIVDRFIYADTDSLHIVGTDAPEGLEVSDTELGAWKIETHFRRARYVRQKSYVDEEYVSDETIEKVKRETPELRNIINEHYKTILKVTSAGMPKGCYKNVTFENYKAGTVYEGKLKKCHVKGGVVLLDTVHTLRE